MVAPGPVDLAEEHVREIGVERPLVTELERAVAQPPTDVVAVVKGKTAGSPGRAPGRR